MSFSGNSKNKIQYRPNYEEMIPDVYKGMQLKKKLPERSAVFLRNSPQMSKFYDETITDLQKSSQDQMTEEMKQNMIRQLAGQTGQPAAASEAGSELLRRLRPAWLPGDAPGTPQFFDMFGDDGDDDFMSTIGDIPDIQPVVQPQIRDGLLALPSSSSASAGLSAHEAAQAMAQIRAIQLADAAAIDDPMDTSSTAVIPGKRIDRPQTIFQQRSPEKKASRKALDDLYTGLAVPEGRPEARAPMLALGDVTNRTQLIDLLTRDLMAKPNLDLNAVFRLQMMPIEDLRKEASLALQALPPIPDEGEETNPRKVKKRPDIPTKKTGRDIKSGSQEKAKKSGSQEKPKKSGSRDAPKTTPRQHGLKWFGSDTMQPTPTPLWKWKKLTPAQLKEHAQMAGVRWTPEDLDHFKKKTMTKKMMIDRVKLADKDIVLP